MDVIAERQLVAVFPDSGPASVHLRIGRPAPHPKGGWVCPVQAEGLQLWQGSSSIAGEDSWQALLLALRFVQAMLSAEAERGVVFHWEDGEYPLSVEELFSLHEIR